MHGVPGYTVKVSKSSSCLSNLRITLVLLIPDLSSLENTVDSDQLAFDEAI